MAEADQHSTATGQKHEVTGTEPAWVESRFRARISKDGDSVYPEYVSDSTRVEDGIDMLHDEAEYSCTCGADLSHWHEVQAHLQEVGHEATNAVRDGDTGEADSETVTVDQSVLRTFLAWTYHDSAIDTAPEDVRAAEESLWDAVTDGPENGGK